MFNFSNETTTTAFVCCGRGETRQRGDSRFENVSFYRQQESTKNIYIYALNLSYLMPTLSCRLQDLQ